jgi:hypothetical protein
VPDFREADLDEDGQREPKTSAAETSSTPERNVNAGAISTRKQECQRHRLLREIERLTQTLDAGSTGRLPQRSVVNSSGAATHTCSNRTVSFADKASVFHDSWGFSLIPSSAFVVGNDFIAHGRGGRFRQTCYSVRRQAAKSHR